MFSHLGGNWSDDLNYWNRLLLHWLLMKLLNKQKLDYFFCVVGINRFFKPTEFFPTLEDNVIDFQFRFIKLFAVFKAFPLPPQWINWHIRKIRKKVNFKWMEKNHICIKHNKTYFSLSLFCSCSALCCTEGMHLVNVMFLKRICILLK